jgi:tetratricopeptide (TPR) repeat protein
MIGVARALLLLLAAAPTVAAEFQLEAREHDTVVLRSDGKERVGRIDKLDDTVVQFRDLKGIRHHWRRDQIARIERRCTLAESYARAAKRAGNDPAARLRLHAACLKAGLKKKAQAELRTAVRIDPRYGPAYERMLELARKAGDLNAELGVLEAARREDVATSAMLLRLARIYVQIGAVRTAEAPLRKLLLLDPQNAAAESRLAMLELAAGRPKAAAERVDALVRRKTKNPAAWYARGQIELARNRLVPAADAFQRAAEGGRSALATAAFAAVEFRRGMFQSAEQFYSAADALGGGMPAVQAGLGLLAAQQGLHKKATRLLDQAVRSSPGDAGVLIARAYAAEAVGNTAAALTTYLDAIKADGGNPFAHAGAGRCHLRQKDRASARAAFTQAAVVRPDFAPALRGLAHLDLGKQPAASARRYRAILKSGDATPDDHAGLGMALIRLRQFGEASRSFARAGADNVHARIGLGFLAYSQGRTDEARRHLSAAVQRGDHRGYAAAAIRKIDEAENRLKWADTFERDPPDGPDVRNGWTEIEPPGIAISIVGNALLIDGTPTTNERLAQLSRPETGGLVSLTVELGTGGEAHSFIGAFITRDGGKPVLIGWLDGRAAMEPGTGAPIQWKRRIPQGRFSLRIELVDRARGAIRVFVNDDAPAHTGREVVVPALAGAKKYTIGLFARPAPGKKVNCRAYAVRVLRNK